MLVLAHRGAAEHCPENSLAAFAEARRLGADGVELDVRAGAGGALVVHHDAEIPGAGPVAALAPGDLPPHVPLLSQALDACRGMVVNVEIKSDGHPALPRSVVALLADRGFTDRVVVSSFDPACLDVVRAAGPSVPAAWLLWRAADAHAALRQAVRAGYQGIHPSHPAVDPALVAEAHAAGLAVRAWTVNEPEDLRAMAACGVDAVVTDRPAAALAVARTS